MKSLALGLAAVAAGTVAAYSDDWQPDVLFPDYQALTVEQGSDYDGPVRCTLVRHHAADSASRRGVLYLHGYSDYFLQDDMGRRFADSCYHFYAVDLRRYGRSLRRGEPRFDVRDLREYFADIDAALARMKQQAIDTIVLMGHSTGGLIASLYMSERPDPAVRALVLNSPFLDWNQSGLQERLLIPAASMVGRWWPMLTVQPGEDPTYVPTGDTRLSGGRWLIDCDWKPRQWLSINAGWLRAIDRAHAVVQENANIRVPIMLMHSDRTYRPADRASLRDSCDTVLDVADIVGYGRRLGPAVTDVTVRGGTHDLLRSAPGIREGAYRALFAWLDRKLH